MRKLKDIIGKTGDATIQVTALFAFAVYFGSALVAGGVSYAVGYNQVFQSDVYSTTALTEAAVNFAVEVLWADSYWWLAILALLALTALFYAARFWLHLIIGYATLVLFMGTIFIGSIWLGNAQGRRDAIRDWSETTTSLPAIKIYVDGKNVLNGDNPDADFDSGDFHLLSLTNDHLLVFVPSETTPSVVTVTALRRSDVVRYEVELK